MWLWVYLFMGIFAFLVALNYKHLISFISGMNARSWLLLGLLILFIGTLYWFGIPNVNRFIDEQIILQKASDANATNLFVPSPMNAMVIGVFHACFAVFGYSNLVAIKCNIFFSLLNVALLFFLIRALFNQRAAWIGAALLAVTTSYILSATSSYTTVISLTAVLITTSFFHISSKIRRITMTLLFVFTLAMLPFARIELLALIPIYFVFWIHSQKMDLKAARFKFLILHLAVWFFSLGFFFPYYIRIFNHKMLGFTEMHYHSFSLLNIKSTFQAFLSSCSSGLSVVLVITALLFLSLLLLYINHQNFHLYLSLIAIVFITNTIMNFAALEGLILFLAILLSGIFSWSCLPKSKRKDLMLFIMLAGTLFFIYLNMSYYMYYFNTIILACWLPVMAISLSRVIELWKGYLATTFLLACMSILLIGSISASFQEEFTTSRNYLDTYSPAIIENELHSDCIFFAAYDFIYESGTGLAVDGLSEKTTRFHIQETECAYFIDDLYCGSSDTLNENCQHIRSTYFLLPALIISRKEINYTVYEILLSRTEMPVREVKRYEISSFGKIQVK